MIKLLDYDRLLEGQDTRRRRRFYRRVSDVVTVFFRIFSTSKDQAKSWLDQYPRPNALPDLTDVLETIAGNRDSQAIATGCYGIREMLEGEIWTEENGIFFIKQCPLGFLIVNGSIDTQECTECLTGSYSLSSTYGCVDQVCPTRECITCPNGASCKSGFNQPWKHFTPLRLMIGPRTIMWATILVSG